MWRTQKKEKRWKHDEKERRQMDHVLGWFQNQDDKLVSPRAAELKHWAEMGR